MGWFENFFGCAPPAELDPEYSATIERIEGSLANWPAEEARYLACVALLAARVANADGVISEGEAARLKGVLHKQLGLPEKEAQAVSDIALESESSLIVEHHLVSRRLNELASREKKISILRTLFHIAAEDDVSEAESDLIGNIASALLLSRADYLSVRSEYSEYRAILKSLPNR